MSNVHNASDLECPSCGAHWMQTCSCSEYDISEAIERQSQALLRLVTHGEVRPLADLVKKRLEKDDEK